MICWFPEWSSVKSMTRYSLIGISGHRVAPCPSRRRVVVVVGAAGVRERVIDQRPEEERRSLGSTARSGGDHCRLPIPVGSSRRHLRPELGAHVGVLAPPEANSAVLGLLPGWLAGAHLRPPARVDPAPPRLVGAVAPRPSSPPEPPELASSGGLGCYGRVPIVFSLFLSAFAPQPGPRSAQQRPVEPQQRPPRPPCWPSSARATWPHSPRPYLSCLRRFPSCLRRLLSRPGLRSLGLCRFRRSLGRRSFGLCRLSSGNCQLSSGFCRCRLGLCCCLSRLGRRSFGLCRLSSGICRCLLGFGRCLLGLCCCLSRLGRRSFGNCHLSSGICRCLLGFGLGLLGLCCCLSCLGRRSFGLSRHLLAAASAAAWAWASLSCCWSPAPSSSFSPPPPPHAARAIPAAIISAIALPLASHGAFESVM